MSQMEHSDQIIIMRNNNIEYKFEWPLFFAFILVAKFYYDNE